MPKADDTSHSNDDWRKGDLALCVKGGRIGQPVKYQDKYPKTGAIFTVEKVGPSQFYEGMPEAHTALALWLDGAPLNGPNQEPVWSAFRFRKIRPLSRQETIDAMHEIVADKFIKISDKKKRVKS